MSDANGKERPGEDSGACLEAGLVETRVAKHHGLGVSIKQQVSTTIADQALTPEALEQHLGDQVRANPHFAEGISAFREKRQPRYE